MKYSYLLNLVIGLLFITETAFAQGFTVGNNTTVSLGSAKVSLPNNFENNGILNSQNGTIIFNGISGDQTITNSTSTSYNNITINKAAGNVILYDTITVTGTLSLTGGDFDLNGNFVIMDGSSILSETSGNTVKGNSGYIEFTEDINAPLNVDLHGLGFEITSGSNLGSTTIKRGNNAQTSNGNTGISRHYSITPSNNTALNATMVFHYDDSELNSAVESRLIFFKSEDGGNSWSPQGGSVDTVNNKAALSGIENFSMWTLADSVNSLTNRQATAQNNYQTKYFDETAVIVELDDIIITDPDGPNEQITATLTLSDINAGSLTVASGNGETYDPATGIWTITNTLINVNTALASVSFEPANDLCRNKTVAVYIADELGSNIVPITGSIALKVLNQPTTSGIDDLNAHEDDTEIIIDLTLYFDDLKNGASGLTYSIENNTSPSLFSSITINSTELVLNFAQEQNGSSVITIRATDSDNLFVESSFTITVNPVNDAPFISEIQDIYKNEDDTAWVQIFVTDPDDNDFIISAVSSDENVSITINEETLILTPAENWNGTAIITLEASDGKSSGNRIFYLHIIAVNDAPVFLSNPNIGFDEDESFTFNPSGCDSLINDPDNDKFAYFLNHDKSCMNVQKENEDCFIFTPPLNWYGVDTMEIGVCDGIDTVYSELILKVNSINDLPIIEGLPESLTILDGKEIVLTIWNFVEDIETPDSLLNFSFAVIPDSINIQFNNPTSRLFLSGKEKFAGSVELSITITDTEGGESQATITVFVETTVSGISSLSGIPDEYQLYQNYPNPFNPTTKIRYGLPYESDVKLVIYNILGQKIISLKSEMQPAGYYEIEWDANKLSSGIYICRLTAESVNSTENFIHVKKMLLVK